MTSRPERPNSSLFTLPSSLSQRQRIEASVYDARVRSRLAEVTDAELAVDPSAPPFPNSEHVEFLGFALQHIALTPDRSQTAREHRILEVGSGTGTLSVYLALQGARVTGVDVSEENVRLAERRACVNGVAERTEFRVAPIESLDDPDGSYDFVFGNQVLHHVELGGALPNIRRLLAPGGAAVFCEPVLLLPEPLRRLRSSRLVRCFLPSRADTPTERSLSMDDLRLARGVFPGAEIHPFHVLSRLQNFVELRPSWVARLAAVDRALLRRLPALWVASRYVVLVLRKSQDLDRAFVPSPLAGEG